MKLLKQPAKVHLLVVLILTPILLFGVVTSLSNRDRTPANTRQLQALLTKSNYVSFFNGSTSGSEVTLNDQTFLRNQKAHDFAAKFRLSDQKPQHANGRESYVCDFMFVQKDGDMTQVAFLVFFYNAVTKEHFVSIEADGMKGYYLIEESSARELSEIFTAHEARLKK